MARQGSLLRPVAVAALLALATAGAWLGGAAGGASAAPTGGCGKAPTLRSGSYTAQINGQSRTYILRVPDSYDQNRPYRLVLAYHWRGGTANDVASGGTDRELWAYYGLQRQGGNSTIFVAPQGIGNGWANSGGQDLAFTDEIVRAVENGLCVDTTQLFALGFSYGGGMSYAIACARASVFRAVAVYSGANLSGCSGGTQPIAYLGIHGISDNVLNISQGRSLRDTFVRANGCTAQNPPEPRAGSLTHILTTYSGCRAGYPVAWAAFDGGHGPGPVDGSTAESGARSWTPAVVWSFFTQSCCGTTTTTTTRSTTTSGTTTSSTTTRSTSTTTGATTTESTGGGGGCTAALDAPNQWQGGFVTNVKVSTAGSIRGWRVTIGLPAGAMLTSGWNATFAGSTGTVQATNVSYNGSVTSSQPQSFGFQGTGTMAGTTLSCTVLG